MKRFAGKVVIVTGAGAGIGKATAERFAAEGARVVIAERDAARGEEVAHSIEGAGGEALFVGTDVSNETSVAQMVGKTVERFRRVDVLVNNAAVFVLKGVEASVEDWKLSLETNVMGPALVAKHVVPELVRAGGGSIINLASISSFIAQPQFVTYNTAKTAILGLTRCLALDLAPAGIRVNAVCPGPVWTQIVERQAAAAGLNRQSANTDPDWGGATLLKRVAEPREIAAAIAFLASDDASYITAEMLVVDGGYLAR